MKIGWHHGNPFSSLRQKGFFYSHTGEKVVMVSLNQPSNNSMHHGPYLREIPADLETPVSIYLKLKNEKPSFLLESVTGGEQLARYSFIGINPQDIYVLRNNIFEHFNGETVTYHPINLGEDPLAILRVAQGVANDR